MKVLTIDCHYLFPEFAAAYLIIEKGRAILIENNTEHSIRLIERALLDHGLGLEHIDHFIVTHAHLDHAGASGKWMEMCPHASLVAHPKAIEHLVKPVRLIEGVKSVYGEERFRDWYGGVQAVSPDRTRAMQEGEILEWRGLKLEFIHTRGHANHHCCIIERSSDVIFTGDTFGLCYPVLQSRGLFIFPTTSPTGYEPQAAIASVRRIAEMGLKTAYLTHFGALDRISEAAVQLIQDLEFSKKTVEDAAAAAILKDRLARYCFDRLETYFRRRIQVARLNWDAAKKLLALDIELNAAGMAHAVGYVGKT